LKEAVRDMSSMLLERRDLLAGCGVLVLMPAAALAQPTTARRFHLRNEHTGETINGPYRDAAGPLPDAHRKALDLKRGGVGWYPRSFFLHIDTGPVRSWEVFGRDLNNLFAPGVRGRLRTVADRMRLHRAIAHRRLSAGR
jgi:hypothetical protein